LIDEVAATDKADRRKKAAEIAVRLIEGCKPYCQGAHLMPLGWNDVVPSIIEGLG
jgi:5,10-methylenetetrahydrofolate reductase